MRNEETMNEDNDDDELFARVRRPAPHDENTDFFAAPLKEVAIPLTKVCVDDIGSHHLAISEA